MNEFASLSTVQIKKHLLKINRLAFLQYITHQAL